MKLLTVEQLDLVDSLISTYTTPSFKLNKSLFERRKSEFSFIPEALKLDITNHKEVLKLIFVYWMLQRSHMAVESLILGCNS